MAALQQGNTHMHPEDLNNIWICSNCQTAFAFHSDIVDHMNKTRHKHIKKFDLNTGRLIEVRAMV
jgi:ribosomal protein L37AE/L43A